MEREARYFIYMEVEQIGIKYLSENSPITFENSRNGIFWGNRLIEKRNILQRTMTNNFWGKYLKSFSYVQRTNLVQHYFGFII